MGSVIKYSGLVTKIRAMRKNLLSEKEYSILADSRDFTSAINYLKTLPAYEKAFLETMDSDIHRDVCERRLMSSLYSDFERVYHFSNLATREYLDVFFMHYEINLIKQSLRNVINLLSPDIMLGDFDSFFHKHSQLTMNGLNHCDTIQEFMQALAGSRYAELLLPIYNSGSEKLQDYEEALDFYYFSETWKVLNKSISKKDQENITAAFGCDIDLSNLRWIIRCKSIFRMEPAKIKQLLIPINYKLSPKVIDELVQAETMDDMYQILCKTSYKSKLHPEDLSRLPKISQKLVADIYKQRATRDPYSLATLACYLHEKEAEIGVIIRMLEAIRYDLPHSEVFKLMPSSVKNIIS